MKRKMAGTSRAYNNIMEILAHIFSLLPIYPALSIAYVFIQALLVWEGNSRW